MNLDDVFSSFNRRKREVKFAIESSGSSQSRVDGIKSINKTQHLLSQKIQETRLIFNHRSTHLLVAPMTTISPRLSRPSMSARRVDTIELWI